MASWVVQIRHSAGQSTTIALIDSFGPSNRWKELESGKFLPGEGEFLNQLKRVAPSVQPSWVLEDLDIDEVSVGSYGHGSISDNPADFPTGSITWRVTAPYEEQ
ncbi:hypothetical protein [Paraburkholderia dipogonis]|uniref:hypothetical protein n=1 Tax=Paraburkholderia dipogonis TaxID=1211383 RepID=UPI0038BCB390